MGERLHIEQRITEANRRWPSLEFKTKGTNEASAACPFCGGTQRFRIWGAGNYECRAGAGQCGRKGWIDENNPKPLTDVERLALQVAAQAQQIRDQEERLQALEAMHQCTDHRKYHERADYEHWLTQGVYPDTVDEWLLGYCDHCPTYRQSASHTIPVFGYDEKLVNIRHRLTSPDGRGKYRPHRKDLPRIPFNCSILKHPLERVLLLEGEVKTIVCSQYGWPSVGVMGQNVNERKFNREWLPWFQNAAEVIVCLDPDATESAQRLGEILTDGGHRNVKIASFPSKPDDLLVLHGANEDDFDGFLALARPVWGKR